MCPLFGGKVNCASCHEMHASDHKALLLSDDEEELCISCHKDQLKLDREYVHDPVDLGMCTICHSPHAAEQEKLLTEDKMDLCLSCHEELSLGLDNAENVHLPADEDCGLCHEIHASDHPSQLLDAAPQLCFECHDDIQTKTELSIGHTAVTSKAGCLNCHTAHHSPHAAMLNGRQSEICLTCHKDALPGKNKKTIASMDDWLHLEFQHGPIQEGNCSSCHDLHGTDVNSILRASYTERFYSSWDPLNFALCFRCHEVSAFLDQRSETLTEFRNGDLNLHFSHVNREHKGRTCRACHETRASASPHHLAESVPFGAWRMPLEYEHLKNGGFCSPGCHSPREYNRVDPVKYEDKKTVKDEDKKKILPPAEDGE